jgi:hypothetical protein
MFQEVHAARARALSITPEGEMFLLHAMERMCELPEG